MDVLMTTVGVDGLCDAVFSQGDKGTSWYIIWKGSVNVITHGKVIWSKIACVHCPVVLELDSRRGVCTGPGDDAARGRGLRAAGPAERCTSSCHHHLERRQLSLPPR